MIYTRVYTTVLMWSSVHAQVVPAKVNIQHGDFAVLKSKEKIVERRSVEDRIDPSRRASASQFLIRV